MGLFKTRLGNGQELSKEHLVGGYHYRDNHFVGAIAGRPSLPSVWESASFEIPAGRSARLVNACFDNTGDRPVAHETERTPDDPAPFVSTNLPGASGGVGLFVSVARRSGRAEVRPGNAPSSPPHRRSVRQWTGPKSGSNSYPRRQCCHRSSSIRCRNDRRQRHRPRH